MSRSPRRVPIKDSATSKTSIPATGQWKRSTPNLRAGAAPEPASSVSSATADFGQALPQRTEGIVGAMRGLGDAAQGRFVEPAAHDLAAAVAHQFRFALLVQDLNLRARRACRSPP